MIINNISRGTNFGMAKLGEKSKNYMEQARNQKELTSEENDKFERAISTTDDNDREFEFIAEPLVLDDLCITKVHPHIIQKGTNQCRYLGDGYTFMTCDHSKAVAGYIKKLIADETTRDKVKDAENSMKHNIA